MGVARRGGKMGEMGKGEQKAQTLFLSPEEDVMYSMVL